MNWTPFVILAVVFIVVVICWYAFEGNWNRRLFSPEPGRVFENLNASEAAAFLRGHPGTQVLDVRSEGEFARGALPGARNLPLADPDFDEKAGILDRTRPVLVYCAGGFRSRKAVERLKAMGFENIRHLHRGYLSWKPGKSP